MTVHGIIMLLLYAGHGINIFVSLLNLLSSEPMQKIPCNRFIWFVRVIISVVTILVFAGVL